ncbi:uncharacterized protein N7496_003276 [Penicillium cataractarum]|uniref:Protein Zds1 C-terminal domain-containing protein n=1 Tax=Penicillium cataractarum TaxID=2100454 RepID=A0A9W9SQX6_9EURO|nr:uncharacterized protein N7496_003276 [Penicillium cataractarum]KAJ5380848.1 hypothetical protein N7496_003276 [Penicillium cataractarum]
MQASTSAPEAGGGHTTRRGHATHLSISDPNHHVTEAIGHMYDDDYDRNDPRRLSYITTPQGEAITTIPRHAAGSESSLSPSTPPLRSPTERQPKQSNGHLRPPLVGQRSFDRDSEPGSPDSTRSPSETATSSFPLNDIDYESNPAAVVQELNNLAAIRRMSMDVAAAGDPDLPSFGSNFSIPSLPPSPSADENDASRLFWVPASLHPELAPKEFKSFLESKADVIKRKSGDFGSSLSPERQGSGSGLRRKRSMLSKQIDDSSGYKDGAERLERQRSLTSRRDGMLSPNLQELESLVDDTKLDSKDLLVRGMQNASIAASEDKPILPPAPPGHSLRRSTRTQYKKGSLKKGEKPPYSKRVGRALSESTHTGPPTIAPASEEQPILGTTRVATDPAGARAVRSPSNSSRGTAYTPGSTTSSTFDSILDNPEAGQQEQLSSYNQSDASFDRSDSIGSNASSQSRQWHSRISSNGRSTLVTPPTEQKVPSIIETPPPDNNRPSPSSSPQPARSPDRDVPSNYSGKTSPVHDSTPSKRSPMGRQSGKEPTSTLDEFANQPQMIPGNSTRTDSLSFIPTMPEERKPEERKSEGKKSKKDSEGRKSSWHWLLGSEEKDKKKEKESEAKRNKSKYTEKSHSNARMDVLQSSMDTTPKGRESLIMDRLDPKLEEERRKDGARRASGDSKKEKDGIFSSIFGGGRKKHSGEGHHRKNSSRNLSPDPPMRELRADVDYPWTRFSILEERAIYRMAHIKLANPRRALYSQVLLSNFMYSYLEKVQQMQSPMMVASSGSQRSSKSRDQPDEYLQYQRYQEAQEQQQYGDGTYDESMYDYDDDPHDRYQGHGSGSQHGYENGHSYNSGHYQYGHSSFGDDVQLDDDDDDDMW